MLENIRNHLMSQLGKSSIFRMIENKETDVLVIGSGGAGCRTALEAFQSGAQVTIVTKGAFGKSGTTAFRVADTAGFNFADGVVDPKDNSSKHYEDIIRAGMGMAYEDLASVLSKEAINTAPYLESLGVHFEKDPSTNQYIELTGCFASRPRMHILKDHGEQIIRAMVPEIWKYPIQIVEHTFISCLLLQGDRCVGAVGISSDGNIVIFHAKVVVLACGGAGQLFKYTLTPSDITGDGYALGLRAGAMLINMEFMQVVLGTIYPTKNQINTFLWCARPRLVNSKGNTILERYLPEGVTPEQCMDDKSKHFPFSSRDNSKYIEIAVQKELLKEEGSSQSEVYIDLTGITDDMISTLPENSPLPKVWPIVRDFMEKRGFAIHKEPVRLACYAHAINGGLKVDIHGRTTTPGLFAVGEVAGGPHGADRLGGNMLVTCQVFGARAGREAAKESVNIERSSLPKDQVDAEIMRFNDISEQKGPLTVEALKDRLREAMWKGVLVVRSHDKLTNTINELDQIKDDIQRVNIDGLKDIKSILELENMIDISKAIALSALHRKESRGSHYREDFPETDSAWRKRILIDYQDGVFKKHEELLT